MNGWPLILFLTLILAAILTSIWPVGGVNLVFFVLAGVVAYVRFVLVVAAVCGHGHEVNR